MFLWGSASETSGLVPGIKLKFILIFFRYFYDIEEKMKKPDYFHNTPEETTRVLLITLEMVEYNILNNYESGGNPAASRKSLLNVWIRLFRTLIW